MIRSAPKIRRCQYTEPENRSNEKGHYSQSLFSVDIGEGEMIVLPFADDEGNRKDYYRFMGLVASFCTGGRVQYRRRGNLVYVID